jgi:opacity protein-like surface antigen
MKHKKIKWSILLLSIGLTAQAQKITTASGGNATGSGGNVAYSIGELIYTTSSSTNGSMTQGVQQPYEISIVLGLKDQQINLNMQAYPNPTNDYLTLTIEKKELSNLNYQLYDINGKLIQSKKITSMTETIQMENLPTATYFLKVINNNNEVKTFKIIKK